MAADNVALANTEISGSSFSPHEVLLAIRTATESLYETTCLIVQRIESTPPGDAHWNQLYNSLAELVKTQKAILRANWAARATLDSVNLDERITNKQRQTNSEQTERRSEIQAPQPSSSAETTTTNDTSVQTETRERVEAIAQRFKAQHEAAIRQMHEEKERRERRALARSTSLNLNQIRASIISPYVKSKQESILAAANASTPKPQPVLPRSESPLKEKIASLEASKDKTSNQEKPKIDMPQVDTSATRKFFSAKVAESMNSPPGAKERNKNIKQISPSRRGQPEQTKASETINEDSPKRPQAKNVPATNENERTSKSTATESSKTSFKLSKTSDKKHEKDKKLDVTNKKQDTSDKKPIKKLDLKDLKDDTDDFLGKNKAETSPMLIGDSTTSTSSKRKLGKAKSMIVEPISPSKQNKPLMTLSSFMKCINKNGKLISPPLSWYGDFWNGIPPLGKEKSETAPIEVWLDRLKTTAEIMNLFQERKDKEKAKVLLELYKVTAIDFGIAPAIVQLPEPPKESKKREAGGHTAQRKHKAKNDKRKQDGSKNADRKPGDKKKAKETDHKPTKRAKQSRVLNDSNEQEQQVQDVSNTEQVPEESKPAIPQPEDTDASKTSTPDNSPDSVAANDNPPTPTSESDSVIPNIRPSNPTLPAISSISTSSRRRVIKSFSVSPSAGYPDPVNNNTPVTPVTPNTPNTPNNTNNNANNNGEQKAETGTDITQSSISTPPPTPSSAPPDAVSNDFKETKDSYLSNSSPTIIPPPHTSQHRSDPSGRRNSADDDKPELKPSSSFSRFGRPPPSPAPRTKRVAFGARDPQKQLVTRRSLTNLKGHISRIKVQRVQSERRSTGTESDGVESPTSPRSVSSEYNDRIQKEQEQRERDLERITAWLDKEKLILSGDGTTKTTRWEEMLARKKAKPTEVLPKQQNNGHNPLTSSDGSTSAKKKSKEKDDDTSNANANSNANNNATKKEDEPRSKKKISFRTMTLNPRMTWEEQDNPRAKKFEEEDSDANIRFADISGEQTVAAATVEKLIQRLTFDSMPDPAYQNCFLLTYRSFMSPKELLDLLKLRWNTQPPPNTRNIGDWKQTTLLHIRLRISNVIKTWIEKFYNDFEDDPELLKDLNAFLDKMEANGLEKPAQMVKKTLAMKAEGKEQQKIETGLPDPPPPHLPKEVKPKYKFLDFHPEEVARQLTLIEHSMFRAIQYTELLGVGWTTKNKEKNSPNVLKMIRFSNHVSGWVASEILESEDVRIRAVTLNRFLIVASICLNLNNFNAAMEIYAALRMSAVFRLRRTWNLLPDEAWEIYEKLETIFVDDSNWKNYRQALEYAVPPAVPYLGRYLSELLFIAEKYPDMIANTELINFGKMYLIADIITQIQLYQSISYRLQRVPVIEEYITSAPSDDAKSLHVISLQREPKAVSRSGSKSEH